MQPPLPLLAVITGRPGAGKSTLANELARQIRCPLVSRDALKEGYLHTMGIQRASDPQTALDVYNAFFSTIQMLLQANISIVAEAAFQHFKWQPKLEPLRAVCDLRIVICELSPDLSWRRVKHRESMDPGRNSFHALPEPAANYEPPVLDVPTLKLDMTQPLEAATKVAVEFLMSGR